jgi:hypothetical protein
MCFKLCSPATHDYFLRNFYTSRKLEFVGPWKLLDDLKESGEYSHLKEEALDRTMWRAGFGSGFGPLVRQTTK